MYNKKICFSETAFDTARRSPILPLRYSEIGTMSIPASTMRLCGSDHHLGIIWEVNFLPGALSPDNVRPVGIQSHYLRPPCISRSIWPLVFYNTTLFIARY